MWHHTYDDDNEIISYVYNLHHAYFDNFHDGVTKMVCVCVCRFKLCNFSFERAIKVIMKCKYD